MKLKFSIIYSWFIRTITFFLPDAPIIMRFRGFLYSLMMKECGRNFQVTSTAIINSLSTMKVGNNVYIGSNTVILAPDVEIEDEVLIGPLNLIVSRNHTLKDGSFRLGPSKREKVHLKYGSWVSGNCCVLPGAVLPASSVLAAGSVLNRPFDVPFALYAGSPAQFKKQLR